MNVATQASEIRKVLKEIAPSHIAVAYVGGGWREYISARSLQEIVVSPTFGSSPRAIWELIKLVGIENVHFMDELHSKIYLGKKNALLGSCNLSNNGLADRHLREAAVVISDEAQLGKLRNTFEQYVKAARDQYPTDNSKTKQLAKLQALVDKAEWNGIPTSEGEAPSLATFDGATDKIHIAWYQMYEPEYNRKAIVAAVPESKSAAPDDFFGDLILFHERDKIKEGDWILAWHCKRDGLPRENGAVDWMRVHHVIPFGVKKNDYTKIAAQSACLEIGTPPFLLTPNIKKQIRTALAEKKFSKLRESQKELWSLAEADELVESFLMQVRNAAEG